MKNLAIISGIVFILGIFTSCEHPKNQKPFAVYTVKIYAGKEYGNAELESHPFARVASTDTTYSINEDVYIADATDAQVDSFGLKKVVSYRGNYMSDDSTTLVIAIAPDSNLNPYYAKIIGKHVKNK